MIYAVIDTNVLVAALLSHYADSATVKVVGKISETAICPLYNDEILSEYKDVLGRDKFKFPKEAINDILKTISDTGVHADRVRSLEEFPDPKDVVFYEVALSKDDAYLVTGNRKHFPKTPIVVTPAEMIKILEDKGLL